MIKGVYGKPYIDLSGLIDHNSFASLHPDICRSFAIAENESSIGTLDLPDGFINLKAYNNSFLPLFKAYHNFLKLPDDHPVKMHGSTLNDRELATYIKYALGGFDLYCFHTLIDFKDGWRESSDPLYGAYPEAKYFPTVLKWIQRLIDLGIFSNIGRAVFFLQESGGVSFEHKDQSVDPEFPDKLSEFIHIRQNLNRPLYVKDIDTNEKFIINSCISYWNDQDTHGGESILEPSYALRVDGVFTDSFREKVIYEARK